MGRESVDMRVAQLTGVKRQVRSHQRERGNAPLPRMTVSSVGAPPRRRRPSSSSASAARCGKMYERHLNCDVSEASRLSEDDKGRSESAGIERCLNDASTSTRVEVGVAANGADEGAASRASTGVESTRLHLGARRRKDECRRVGERRG